MYKLTKLKYLYQDLEPYIDTHTIALHYNKHAMNYLDKLNSILKMNNYNFKYSLNNLFFYLNDFKYEDREDILFNLGGVLNHELYFKCLSKEKLLPNKLLKRELDLKYGSYNDFVNYFINEALKLKGAGYTFLEITLNGDLLIINRSNQDNPIFHQHIPLFCIDMWEHSYYLNYKISKKEYLTNIFEVIDFSYANDIYSEFRNNYI